MFVILPLTLGSFDRPILFIIKWSPHAAISMPYCIFFYFFPFVVTCWLFVILLLTLQSFNHPIIFVFNWNTHAANSMTHYIFCDYLPLFLSVKCILYCYSLFEVSTGWYFSYQNEALMLLFLCRIAYFSTSFPFLWPVECLLFFHSLFKVSTNLYFLYSIETLMLLNTQLKHSTRMNFLSNKYNNSLCVSFDPFVTISMSSR